MFNIKVLKNIFYVTLPTIIGIIVSLLINNHIDYKVLVKPPLAPPSIIFPIAWSIIYVLLGISFYLYKKNGKPDKKLDVIYYLGLLVNAFWSIIFFLWKMRFLAIIWIILLVILVIYLLKLFKDNYKPSLYLNIPYLLWILFATYLTIGIYILN